jgi:copper homeostasis protein
MIEQAKKACSIPVFPIIRPRGGDFLYSKEEFEAMKSDIKNCLSIGCEGVVVGMLMANGSIDVERNSELVAAAGNMEVTFHRAFDRVADPEDSLENVITIGCKRILTSGLHKSALEGKQILMQLVEQAAGRIEIMLGSGVRANNVVELAVGTGARAFHSSARMQVASKMLYNNPKMVEELKHASLDAEEVKKLKEQLDQYFNPKP